MTEFIVAVSGSRSITDQSRVWEILDLESVEPICAGYNLSLRLGDARGVDYLALQWARDRGLTRRIYFASKDGYDSWVSSAPLPGYDSLESAVLCSDWDDPREGPQAGQIRNSAMIGVLEPKYRPVVSLCVAIWDGVSEGTRHCAAQARNALVPIHQWGGSGPIKFRSGRSGDEELITYHPPLY